MTVADFILKYQGESVSAATPKELLKKFKKVKHEDVLTLGNDTLLALEFNTTWQDVKEFVSKQKPKA